VLPEDPATHIGTLSLLYRNADLPHNLTISGVMIQRRERHRIDAITRVTGADNPRVPSGYTVLKLFFGGGTPSTAALDDAALLTTAQEELRAQLVFADGTRALGRRAGNASLTACGGDQGDGHAVLGVACQRAANRKALIVGMGQHPSQGSRSHHGQISPTHGM
jgi:hypothetical protein